MEMVGYGTWNQPAGTITDDTEQALCIARSLAENERFDPADIAERFVNWYASGPFDVGGMTARALSRLQRGAAWDKAGVAVWEEGLEGSNAGNGSVMRAAPLAIVTADAPQTLARISVDSSRITHADPRCTYGTVLLNLTIAAALNGDEQPLHTAREQLRNDIGTYVREATAAIPSSADPEFVDGLPRALAEAIDTLLESPSTADLSTSGYVVDTLQTALHDAVTASSLEEAIVKAVNRGGDADTIGAVTGAIAGARFGAEGLPRQWVESIDEVDELRRIGEELSRLTLPK